MNALLERTLMINLICSTVVFYVGAWIYVLPKVGKTNERTIPNPRGGHSNLNAIYPHICSQLDLRREVDCEGEIKSLLTVITMISWANPLKSEQTPYRIGGLQVNC